MIYKEYSTTSKKISIVGLGGMRFLHADSLEYMAEMVLLASNRGINYFDTAPGYCDDKSEIALGHAFKELKRQKKLFYTTSKTMANNPSDVRSDLERSLHRLNVDYLDFYYCWNISSIDDWKLRKEKGGLKELLKAKEEGFIKHIMFSSHLAGNEIETILDENIFEGVTFGFSAINYKYRKSALIAAYKKNIGVTVMNPLGGGIITENADTFSFLKIRDDQSILDAALHYLVSQKEINSCLVGARDINDINTACNAVDSFVQYHYDEIENIEKNVSDKLNNLCTGCMYCKGCPEKIEIWKFMESANYMIIKSNQTVRDRLKNYWGLSIEELEHCTQCNKCEEHCTQKLPILKRLRQLKKIYKYNR
jgi:predicted aldo/keto reductase-like oxidoreductase